MSIGWVTVSPSFLPMGMATIAASIGFANVGDDRLGVIMLDHECGN
jgi:hypothetical protein